MNNKPNKTSYKPGQSGNTNGRPKGTPNRTTAEIREFIQRIVSKNLDSLDSDLDIMNPFQRWQTLEKISKYFLPTFNKTELEGELNGEIKIKIQYEDLIPKIDDDKNIE